MNKLNKIIYNYNKHKWLKRINNMDAYRNWHYTFDIVKYDDNTYDVVHAPMRIWDFWREMPCKLLNDKDIKALALQKKLKMNEMPYSWRVDKEMATAILNYDGLGLEHVGTDLQNDREVVQTAINQNPEAIKFASRKLKKELASEIEK